MNLTEYLNDLLTSSWKYELSNDEKKTIQFEKIDTFIFRKLKSKKFRKTSLDKDSEERIKGAITLSTSKNEPIKITYPFGGYKSWRLESYPEVDWAEFFTIAYLVEYVSPIAEAYKPGVEIQFSSDDKIIELIDNYPREDLDRYIQSFRKLLAEFKKYLPENLKVNLYQVSDLYSNEEYDKDLKEAYNLKKKEGFAKDVYEKQLELFNFNFNWKGKEDYSNLDENKKKELIDELMFWSMGYLQIPKRRAFVRGEDKIVVFSSKISNAIDIGSTHTSMAKFWVGAGILEEKNNRYFERIVTPNQLESIKDLMKVENINIINGKNFQEINIFEGRANFKS